MGGTAETAANGGDFTLAILGCLALGIMGFIVMVFPGVLQNKSSKWIFGFLVTWLVKCFDEKWQSLVARIIGALYMILAFVGLVMFVFIQKVSETVVDFAETQQFNSEVRWALQEMKFPYSISFTDDYTAELVLPEKPGDPFIFNFESLTDQAPEDVAKRMLSDADQYFSGAPPSQPGMLPGSSPPAQGMLPPSQPLQPGQASPAAPTITEDLPYADRLITQAHEKWQQGDYQGSVKLAEKALQIKKRILGESHVKVLELQNQVTNARKAAFQKQMAPASP